MRHVYRRHGGPAFAQRRDDHINFYVLGREAPDHGTRSSFHDGFLILGLNRSVRSASRQHSGEAITEAPWIITSSAADGYSLAHLRVLLRLRTRVRRLYRVRVGRSPSDDATTNPKS